MCRLRSAQLSLQMPPPGQLFARLCGPTWRGGRSPYQFWTENGFPPPGLRLLSNGLLTGTAQPAAAGKTYDFTVCARDLAGASNCTGVLMQVARLAAPLALPYIGEVPAGHLGVPYRFSFCTPVRVEHVSHPILTQRELGVCKILRLIPGK